MVSCVFGSGDSFALDANRFAVHTIMVFPIGRALAAGD
jgi:hypothetical protein